MWILLYIVALVGGIIMLIYGANAFVGGASSIAKKLKISPLIIGVTIVAIGTSLPELAVSVSSSITAALNHTTADISLGNVIGSNIANIALVMGVGLLFGSVDIKNNMKFDIFFFIISACLLVEFLFFFSESGIYEINRLEGIFLLLGVIIFIVLLVIKTKKENRIALEQVNLEEDSTTTKESETKTDTYSLGKAILLFLIGLVGVVAGGYATTYGAENLSTNLLSGVFGMDLTKAKTLIGLSVVAVGTSLPELVTSVVALKRKETEISIGNVIGSNIFNILLILGVAGSIFPLQANGDVLFDSLVSLGITVVFSIVLLTCEKIGKKTGIVFLITYGSYLIFIILRAIIGISIW